ncbi:NAD(P)-binding protein [Aspergillus eucalypticola CBS 122712]|uniref:NAD(P)-binding protein n=1 Tax=Aspergillus eucalypticola (strain CBS 122712 / IBT 29274) TaxID=1448314 RepID=A0A317W0M2_ASPEC|nr:NAD(P)-binding protein [Aspergillus eucalypticola CBS 122712]PWY77680.1 NAD(P)-binding protein [Aspergillus eucalypticola CBS 122712]
MPKIETVAIAGASGTLGPHVFQALVNAGFRVSILSRSNKPGAYASNINVFEVDFNSVESLTTALKGVDAVVSTVGGAAVDNQTVLIDAAIAAGVKRFIPSEFGNVTTNPKVEKFPVYSSVFKIRNYLQENAAAGKLSWTVLACGAFLDLVLNTPTLLDFQNHTVIMLDEGDNRISSTSLPAVGRAIAAILQNFDATENRVMHVSEAILTQNQLIGFAKEIRPDIEWSISKEQSSLLLQESLEQFGAGDFSVPTFMKLMKGTALAGDTYGAAFDVTDNELLGIKELAPADLKKLIAEKLA